MVRPLVPREDPSPASSSSSAQVDQKPSKRRCVQSACVPCRRRKSKCDGATPYCGTCLHVYHSECSYDFEPSPRRAPKGSQKRENSAIAEQSPFEIIVSSIQSLPEHDVQDVVNAIRKRDDIDKLAESLKNIVLMPQRSESREQGDSSSVEEDLSAIERPTFTTTGPPRHFGHTSGLGLVVEEMSFFQQSPQSQEPSGNDHLITEWTNVTKDVDLIRELVSLYFTWAHPFYVVLHREHFYRDFLSGRTKFCSSLLVNAICAYASHYSEDPRVLADKDNPKSKGDEFFAEARELLYLDESVSMTTVQALAIMGVREPSAGRDSSGYMYVGRCLRMALEMGLHLSMVNEPGKSKADKDVRKVTFWGCFNMDAAWSLCIGRTCSFPRTAISLEKPMVDEALSYDRWVQYFPAKEGQTDLFEEYNKGRQFMHRFSLLSEIVNDMLFMYYAPRDRLSSKRLLEMYGRYQNWYTNLPKSLQLSNDPKDPAPLPNVIILHMYYNTSVACLFRPLLRVDLNNSEVKPRQVCFSTACEITRLFDVYRQHFPIRYGNVLMIHILLTTCITHLTNMNSPVKEEAIAANSGLIKGLHDLEELSPTHGFAERSFNIIYLLARKWRLPFPPELHDSPLMPRKQSNLQIPSPPAHNPPIATGYISPSDSASTVDEGSTPPSNHAAMAAAAAAAAAQQSHYPPSSHSQVSLPPTTVPFTSPGQYHHQFTFTHPAPPRSYTTTHHPQAAHMNAQTLFWTPFQGQGIPLYGDTTIDSNPMALDSVLEQGGGWAQYQRDGFRLNDEFVHEPVGMDMSMLALHGMGAAATTPTMWSAQVPDHSRGYNAQQ